MRRTPTGQRPQLDQAHSSGWRWPRLVPIQEQHARAPHENRLSARSSRAQLVHDKGDHTPSPTELAETPPIGNPRTEEAALQAPTSSTAESASATGISDIVPTELRSPSETKDSALFKDIDEDPSIKDTLPQSPGSSVAGIASPVKVRDMEPTKRKRSAGAQGSTSTTGGSSTDSTEGRRTSQAEGISSRIDNPATEATERMHPGQAEGISSATNAPASESTEHGHPDQASGISSVMIHPATGSTEHRHSNDINDTSFSVGDSATEPAGHSYSSDPKGSVSTLSGLEIQPSASADGRLSKNVTDEAIESVSNEAEQGSSIRRGTVSNGEKADVRSVSEGEAADAGEGPATDKIPEKGPGLTPTPVAPKKDGVSVPSDPIPYYANPKIMVHKPSESFQSDTSGPRTIDEILAREREDLAFEDHVPAREVPLPPAGSSAMPQLTRLPTGAVVHKALKVKRRNLYLRKARNLAARKTILQITLGRQLAVPTKQSLRQLANGKRATVEFPVTSQTSP